MKKCTIALLSLALLLITVNIVNAQRITVTVVGTGVGGFNGDGHPGVATQISSPFDVCTDGANNVYFFTINTIRKLSAKYGTVTTIAGGGSSTADGIPATDERLGSSNICSNAAGDVFVVVANNKIKKIDAATGIITTFAGTGISGYSGDGGPATNAKFNDIFGLGVDKSGNIYLEDGSNFRIRKIDAVTGIVTTIAGTGVKGYSGDGGPATSATLSMGRGINIGINPAGDVFFVDQSDPFIRKINATTGIISTIAGGGGTMYGHPALMTFLGGASGLCADKKGDLYFDEWSCSCRKLDAITDTVYPVAGIYYVKSFGDDTNSLYAPMAMNEGLCADTADNIYIADYGNDRIRKLVLVTHLPKFAFGEGQSINACIGTAFSINKELSITDMDYAQPETWSVVSAPVNGTLSGFPYTTTSVGPNILLIPTGLSYIPGSGYSGTDSFRIRVTDGTYVDTVTIYVSMSAVPTGVISTKLGPGICLYKSATFSETITGGIWSVTNSNASITTSGVATGLASGNDTILYSVSYFGCTVADSYAISVVAPPNAGIISGNDSFCMGNLDTLSESVGDGEWVASSLYASVSSAGIVKGLSPGIAAISYSVSNVCGTAIASKLITIDTFPSAGVITGTTIVCPGASIALSDAITWGTWSVTNSNATVSGWGIINGISMGIDTIIYTVSNTCGTDTSIATITINPSPDAGTIISDTTVCMNASITLSDAITGGMWTQTNGHGMLTSSGIFTGYTAGIDTIIYSVSNSCGGAYTMQQITVVDCEALGNPVNTIQELSIFPNPASTVLNIEWNNWASRNTIIISDIIGREVWRTAFTSNGIGSVQADVSNLISGVYFIKINGTEGRKFVKE